MSRGPGRRPWCIAPTRPCSASRRGGALCEVMGTSPRVAKIGGLKGSGEGVVSERPGAQRFSAGRCDRRLRSRPGLHRCGESMWLDSGRHDSGNPGRRHHGGGAAWHLYEAGMREYLTLPQWRRRSSRRAGSLIVAANAARKISSAASRDPFGQRPHRPGRRIHDCLPATGTHHSCRLSGKGGGVARAITGGRPRCGVGVGVRVRTRR